MPRPSYKKQEKIRELIFSFFPTDGSELSFGQLYKKAKKERISPTTLNNYLKTFMEEDLIIRKVDSEARPPKVTYNLFKPQIDKQIKPHIREITHKEAEVAREIQLREEDAKRMLTSFLFLNHSSAPVSITFEGILKLSDEARVDAGEHLYLNILNHALPISLMYHALETIWQKQENAPSELMVEWLEDYKDLIKLLAEAQASHFIDSDKALSYEFYWLVAVDDVLTKIKPITPSKKFQEFIDKNKTSILKKIWLKYKRSKGGIEKAVIQQILEKEGLKILEKEKITVVEHTIES